MALSDLGRNLRRFMKLKNISIQKLSIDSNLGTATLSNIINNKASPSLSTIEKIANTLQISTNDLFLDIPKLQTLKYRTNKITAREIPELDFLQMNVAFWLQDYEKLEEQLNDKIPFALGKINERDPVKAALEVRKYFFERFEIPVNAPLIDLIQIIEQCGIKIYITPFGFKQTFGMSVGKDDNGPAIIINNDNSVSTERKRYTIAHELGHIILHSDMYADSEKIENDNMEKEANSFAAELLMPTESFINQWNACFSLNFVDSVLKVKQYFGVSYKTVLYRLSEITKRDDLYKTFSMKYKHQTGHDLKNHYEPCSSDKEVFKSTRFTSIVTNAYMKKIISEHEASNLLNIDSAEIKDFLDEQRNHLLLNVSL